MNIDIYFLLTRFSIFLVWLVFFCLNSLVFGQNNLGQTDILIPDRTNAFIGVTKSKELLIGSSAGWVIFDGHHAELFDKSKHVELIDHNVQSHFYSGTDGKIWFSSYQSLICFDIVTKDISIKQFTKDDFLLDSDYYIFHLENDTIYGSIEKEFFIYDITSGIIEFPGIKFDNHWTRLFRIENEIHLINYYKRSSTLHLRLNKDFLVLSEKVLPIRTDDVILYGSNVCRLASNNGIIDYNLINQTFTNRFPVLADKMILSILAIDIDEWICSDDQGNLFRIMNNEVTTISNPLNDKAIINHIWKVDGNVILSSYKKGVFLFTKNFTHFKKNIFPFSYSPTCIIPLEDQFYISSNSYCPTIFNKQTAKFKPLQNYNCTRVISGFNITNGGMLTTFEENANLLHLSGDATISKLQIPKEIEGIYLAQYHPSIGKVSICTYSGHMYLGKIQNSEFVLEEDLKWDDKGRGIGFMICTEQLIIASVNDQYGILYINQAGKFKYDTKLELPGYINAFQIDTIRNCIWIASQYGLLKFNLINNILERESGFIDKGEIKGILLDDLNRLWLSTSNGLYLHLPEKRRTKKYGSQDGLPNQNFSSGIATELSNGDFLFGGNFGWVEFKPEDFDLEVESPRIKLKKVLLNDNIEIDNSQFFPITLSHKINVVSLQFAAVSLLNGFANNVKYRLFPEEKEYIDLKSATGFARYSHLKPGSYQFQILAADASGVWGDVPYSLDITVYPPWWETWWFRLIAIISLGAIIYYFVRDYYKRQIARKDILLREQKLIIEKQEAVQNERTRIAAEMHDDLGSGLTTIKYLSDRAMRNVSDPVEIKNIQQISEESNELVRNMSEIIWAMNARFDTLENLIIYIRRFAYEFLDQHQIAFELQIPDEIPDMKISGEKRRNIFLVVKEALHNVVKHSGSPSAIVRVTFEPDLYITIMDQGANELHDQKEGSGNGLYNMKQRMKKLGGTYTIENKSGWTVTLSLPLKVLYT